jgi:hypothetical protein
MQCVSEHLNVQQHISVNFKSCNVDDVYAWTVWYAEVKHMRKAEHFVLFLALLKFVTVLSCKNMGQYVSKAQRPGESGGDQPVTASGQHSFA